MVYIYVLEKKGTPVYIGKSQDMNYRFSNHKYKKRVDNYFIIDEVSEYDWKFWESYYINLFKSWGYILENKNNGGGGCKKGVKLHSEEQKLKWKKERAGQKIRLGQKDSLETIEKRKKSRPKHNIKPHSNKGIPLKDEHRIKCAENKYKSVLIFKDNQLIKECISIKETAVFLKCSKGNISQNLKGKTKTCKGYIIKYK